MNERMAELVLEQLDPPLPPQQADWVLEFCAFMDHNSVWLTRHARSSGKWRFEFTDDARTYRLTAEEMKAHLDAIARGERFPWEDAAISDHGPPAPPTTEQGGR